MREFEIVQNFLLVPQATIEARIERCVAKALTLLRFFGQNKPDSEDKIRGFFWEHAQKLMWLGDGEHYGKFFDGDFFVKTGMSWLERYMAIRRVFNEVFGKNLAPYYGEKLYDFPYCNERLYGKLNGNEWEPAIGGLSIEELDGECKSEILFVPFCRNNTNTQYDPILFARRLPYDDEEHGEWQATIAHEEVAKVVTGWNAREYEDTQTNFVRRAGALGFSMMKGSDYTPYWLEEALSAPDVSILRHSSFFLNEGSMRFGERHAIRTGDDDNLKTVVPTVSTDQGVPVFSTSAGSADERFGVGLVSRMAI